MNKNPLVTIICLCYNHEKFVIEGLNSVVNQTYKNIEIIIIDDCSSDSSVKIIEDWIFNKPQIRFIKNQTNLGNTKTFNKAFKFAKGDYIIDFATDDLFFPNCIEKQIEKFENSTFSNVGIVYGNCQLIDENEKIIAYYFDTNEQKKLKIPRKSGNEYSRILMGKSDAMCSVSAMINREVFDKIGNYDENLDFEDLDFFIRTARVFNFDFIDDVIFKKRIVKNSLGNNFQKKRSAIANKMNDSSYLIIKKALQLNQNKAENYALLNRIKDEMIVNFRNQYYLLSAKYLVLMLKISLKNVF